MILILTQAIDSHADLVIKKLGERGADVIRFNPAHFPVQSQLSLTYSPTGSVRYFLQTSAGRIDLDQVTAAWYRRPEAPIPHAEITDKTRRDFVAQESKAFTGEVWDSLDCFWLPGPPSIALPTQRKAAQLKVAAQLGFELPPTLITNSPEDFVAFYQEHQGNIVSKLEGFAFAQTIGFDFCRYTELVSKRDLGYMQAVRYCPIIFQAYVPKRLELRVTVVGRQVFAAAILSQASNHTRYDWRHYDIYEMQYQVYQLPDDLAELYLDC